jgi:hypothetical protein
MNVTKNFSNQEIGCRCGCGRFPRRESQLKLQKMREIYGRPMSPTSGARCKKHELSINPTSKLTSSHIVDEEDKREGMAFDISIAGLSDAEVLYMALCAGQAGFTRIAVNRKRNFLHVDDDSTKPTKFWSY